MQKSIDLKSPIFSINTIDDKLIVACGGGDKKFGVKNKILLYQLKSGYISEQLCEEDLGNETPIYIESIPTKKIFCFCTENEIIFYSLSKENNKFNKIYTFNLENAKSTFNCLKINEDLLAAGLDNGCLKLYKINFNNNQINSLTEISSNEDAHWKSINKIEFGKKNNINFLITASGDGTCKLFDITKQEKIIKMISKFSFRQFVSESSNYFMRDLIYDNQKKICYTLQSPLEGDSFLTKWDFNNLNFITPIQTIKICNVPCPSMAITNDKNYIGVTNRKGQIFFVDANNLNICGKKTVGQSMLKHCKFYGDNFITGSIDYMLYISKLSTGFNFGFLKYLYYVAMIAGIGYYIYLKKNNLLKED